MKKLLSALLFSVAATSIFPSAAEAANFYVSTNNGQIGRINPTTGEYTQLFASPTFTDIALNNSGDLWGITFDSLYSVDLNTGISTSIGILDADLNGLGFTDDGLLYGTGGTGFYSIDTNTGIASRLFSIPGFFSSGDIVFDAARDLFWATSAGDFLWSLTREGTATRVGNIGYGAVYGLAFGEDKTLLGYTETGLQLALNLETGSGTLLGSISGLNGGIWGAASKPNATASQPPVSTPEPSVLVGFSTLVFLLRRKKSV